MVPKKHKKSPRPKHGAKESPQIPVEMKQRLDKDGNIERHRRYKVGIDYWKKPDSGNAKEEYLDTARREKYTKPIIEFLKSHYNNNDEFKLHELGMGWGTNLFLIKQHFPNCVISGNDVWKEALAHVRKVDKHISVTEMDTFDFGDKYVQEGKKFDVIISNAHIIHLPLNKLPISLSEICSVAYLQENINFLENGINMDLVKVSQPGLPDADYAYVFKSREDNV